MALNISGIEFFMPVFSFLFVFVVVFALLAKTKILGDSKFINSLISFIVAVVFMSFSSLELYVKTIMPWFVVLVVVVFCVLLIAGLSTKSWEKMMTPAFAWVVVGILIIIFLVAAIRVFNPVFHPDLGITSGGGFFGSLILIVVGALVAWVLTKK